MKSLNLNRLIPITCVFLFAGCQNTPPDFGPTLGDLYDQKNRNVLSNKNSSTDTQSDQDSIIEISSQEKSQTDKLDRGLRQLSTEQEKNQLYQRLLSLTDSQTVNPTLEIKLIVNAIKIADIEFENNPQKTDHYDQVLPELKDWLAQNTDHSLYTNMKYQYARILDVSQKEQEAIQVLSSIVKSLEAQNPEQLSDKNAKMLVETYFRLGEFAFSNNQYEKAIDYYTKTIRSSRSTEENKTLASSDITTKSIYMRGWSHLQLSQLDGAVRDFIKTVNAPETNQVNMKQDALRGIVLTVHDNGGMDQINELVPPQSVEPIAEQLYNSFLTFYKNNKLWSESFKTYKKFQSNYPKHPEAIKYQQRLISHLIALKQFKTASKEKGQYVLTYGPKSPSAYKYTLDLAETKRVEARQSKGAKKQKAYKASLNWYNFAIKNYPKHSNFIQTRFAYAETLQEAGFIQQAQAELNQISNVELTQKQASPENLAAIEKSMYLEILGLDQRIANKDASAVQLKYQQAQRFIKKYPEHKEASKLTAWLAQTAFDQKKFKEATSFSRTYLNKYPKANNRVDIRSIYADALYGQGEWNKSIQNYDQLIKKYPSNKNITFWKDQKSKALYQIAQQTTDPEDRIRSLQSVVANATPELAQAAAFEAAVLSAKTNPAQGVRMLEDLQRRFPQHPQTLAIKGKLIEAYKANKNWSKAANELESLSRVSKDKNIQTQSLYEASKYYNKADQYQKSKKVTLAYLARKPESYYKTFAAQARLVSLEKKLGNTRRAFDLMERLVEQDLKSEQATKKTRAKSFQYAEALALEADKRYRSIRITSDLQSSFKRKKSALEAAAKKYNRLRLFNKSKGISIANKGLGDLYVHLSQSLIDSPVPPQLSSLEKEEYQLILEEQAYGFEQEAIDSHKKNILRLHKNAKRWSPAVEKSLKTLSDLAPIQYRKPEITYEGLIHVD